MLKIIKVIKIKLTMSSKRKVDDMKLEIQFRVKEIVELQKLLSNMYFRNLNIWFLNCLKLSQTCDC